jgi:DNA-binding SARP family transcriptional activator
MDDYHSMDSWIEWLDQHQDAFERVEDPTLREAVAVSMTWAIMHRQPDHPHILKWVKETERILGEGFHPQIRLRAGTVAMFFHFLSGDQAACDVLLHRIHALADALREPMAILTSYWAETLVLFWTQAVPGHCREVVERGLALGERYGIHFYDYWFHGLDVVLDISAGKLERARGGLESLAPTVCGHHAQALYQLVISWLDFARGDLSAAAAHAELSVREAASCGQIFIQGLTRVLLADLKLEMGCLEEAQVQSGLAEALVRRVPNPILEIPFHLGAARQALAGFPGEPGPALEHVRRAMALEREYGGTHYHQLWGKPAWTTVVCLTALEHGIETAFALRTIRRHGLRPTAPPVHCQAWPWEIRITTLGQFSIQRNDQLLVFPVKVPWKVLLMLKALIAGGPGGVTEARIADGLWPDIDGDTARKSLDTTLHRLRQLLGLDGIITLRDGWLSLDPYRCWVDAHAFELLLASSPASQSAIDLYRGEFLGDLDQIWAVAYRERLRDGYVRGVLAQGHQCEIRSDFSGAIEWYEKGLEAAPQAELLYRRSMVCHRANGSRTEALRVFERCCMMLKATLDIDPSRETLHLASTLREAQPGR